MIPVTHASFFMMNFFCTIISYKIQKISLLKNVIFVRIRNKTPGQKMFYFFTTVFPSEIVIADFIEKSAFELHNRLSLL